MSTYSPVTWRFVEVMSCHRATMSARYAGQAASIDLDGNVIAGSLPPRGNALVGEWARLHRGELEANWERSRREQELEPVEPLP